jgi:hypothetical protein
MLQKSSSADTETKFSIRCLHILYVTEILVSRHRNRIFDWLITYPLTFSVFMLQKSSSADTETEFFSGNDNDNTSNMSPFNMTGGFDDGASPSPSELENMEDEDGAVS